jgi:hypothetical protein
MDDLSQTSILIDDKNENRLKYFFSRLSTVREDSQEDDNQTIINEQNENDQQSYTSDFDIIESINDFNELNEGI